MEKKVTKPVIKPFENNETVTLLCGGKFTVQVAHNEGCNLDITSLVYVSGDKDSKTVMLGIRAEALESLKLLVKRAEKTFQKR